MSNIISGDYIAILNTQSLNIKTPGSEDTVYLRSTLPGEISMAINSNSPVYAVLGCRKEGLREHVLIVPKGYNAENNSLRIIRGQSPFYTGTGGKTFNHTGNNLELNFYAINPFALAQLIDRIDTLDSDIVTYLANKLPKSTTTYAGASKISYQRAGRSVDEDVTAIAVDSPLIQSFLSKTLDIPLDSETLKLGSTIDNMTQDKINKLASVLNLVIGTKYNQFLNLLENL